MGNIMKVFCTNCTMVDKRGGMLSFRVHFHHNAFVHSTIAAKELGLRSLKKVDLKMLITPPPCSPPSM